MGKGNTFRSFCWVDRRQSNSLISKGDMLCDDNSVRLVYLDVNTHVVVHQSSERDVTDIAS